MRMWDPFGDVEARLRDLDIWRRELERSLAGNGETHPVRRVEFLPGAAARAYPLTNLSEDADAYYVEALAPGVEPSSLNVSVVRNTLTISGEKLAPQDVSREAFHRSERAAGRFIRTVELPADMDASKVAAQYADGLLTVTLPKPEQAKPRQIQVAVS